MTSGKRVTITGMIHPEAENRLRQAGVEVTAAARPGTLSREELRVAAAGSDAVLCLLTNRIDAELIQAAPRCRVYANYAVGYDNMDVEAATRAGVALCNTPDVLTEATAEFAWALLFAAARRVVEGDRFVREGKFHGWDPMLFWGYDLAYKTLGIVGAGRIGGAMGRRAAGFQMPVLYTKTSGTCPELDAIGGRRVELDQLLAESDFISLHPPLTPATRHLIGEPQLARMKRTAILINTGRGPLVDEKALAQALKAGTIAGAGLDVFEREPLVEPELMTLPNVVLAPHIASATYDARRRMAELAAQNILDALSGRVPRCCINPAYQKQ